MNHTRLLPILALALLALPVRGQVSDYFNGVESGAYAYTNATRWSPSVAGAADTAWFTNATSYSVTNTTGLSATNANTYFDASSGTVTQNFSAGGPYWVSNTFGIGHSSFSTAAVTWAGGSGVWS
ncbi:MAG: hypothetical protein ACOYMV_09650, partial [Verrucomicrobiia bacterium]